MEKRSSRCTYTIVLYISIYTAYIYVDLNTTGIQSYRKKLNLTLIAKIDDIKLSNNIFVVTNKFLLKKI